MKLAFKQFFRQTEVRGLENIPTGVPLILAPNHQSGLVDPLVVLFNRSFHPIVFMARADIFKNKLAAAFLRFLKIMPVFRIRDGYENLGKNEIQFNEAKDVLLDSKTLCLMPEGNHGNQHKIRPLVKGLFRIALSAEEELQGKTHVRIVPVGIDHSHFQHAGSDVVLSFGKSIAVEEYLPVYKENPANGLNILRAELADRLSLLMHDIRSEERYDLIYKLCCLGTPAWLEVQSEKDRKPTSRLKAGLFYDARKALGMKLDELDKINSPLFNEWQSLCINLDKLPGYPDEVATWMEYKSHFFKTVFSLVLTLPFIPGMLLNTPAWLICRHFCRKIADKQMHNTFAFAVGFIVNPLFYITAGILVGVYMNYTWTLTIALIGLIGCYGILSERWRQELRLPFRRFRYAFGKRKTVVRNCRTDYFWLKKSIMNWLKTS